VQEPSATPDPASDLVPDEPCDTPTDDGAARRRAVPRWLVVLAAVSLVLSLTIVVGSQIKTGEYLLSPGSAVSTESEVQISGAPTFPHDGRFYLTTVGFQDLNVWTWLAAKTFGDGEIIPKQNLNGDRSDEEVAEQNRMMMESSKISAQAAAFGSLDIPYTFTSGEGAYIAQIADDVPAADLLRIGDVVVAIDGKKVVAVTDLANEVTKRAPGDSVTLTVRRNGTEQEVPVELTAAQDRTVIGVQVRSYDYKIESDVTVKIRSEGIGGPSAGLAYALTIVQELSPEDIAFGKRVATTGEISPDGSVGAVGGVDFKTIAAEREGVELFLVPAGNYAEARKAADAGKMNLAVAGVNTLDEARAVIKAFAEGEPVGPAPELP
jgi:PDZ domain-containing protein